MRRLRVHRTGYETVTPRRRPKGYRSEGTPTCVTPSNSMPRSGCDEPLLHTLAQRGHALGRRLGRCTAAAALAEAMEFAVEHLEVMLQADRRVVQQGAEGPRRVVVDQ